MKKFMVLVSVVMFILSFSAFTQAAEKGAVVVTPQKGGAVTVSPPAKELEKPAAVEQVPTKPQTAKALKVRQTIEANNLRLKQSKEAKVLKDSQVKAANDLKAKEAKEAVDLKAKK